MAKLQLTLLQMSMGRGGEPLAFAPHIWKSLLPLRLLEVDFTTEFYVSAQLEQELPQKLSLPKVTLPTLLVDEADGTRRVIVDSFNIALFLEKTFSTARLSLFSPAGNASPLDVEAGKSTARFLEHWVNTSLAAELRPCTIAAGYDLFPTEGPAHDPQSRARFLSKVGPEKMDELRRCNSDPRWAAEQHEKVRKHLSIMEAMLRERHERGEPGRFMLGTRPTHADFVIFAFYPYSLVNEALVKETWRKKEELPFVSRWLDAVFETGLVTPQELLPCGA